MRIKNIEIANFRAIKHARVDFNDYTALVGANGAGKSTILSALNIFFQDQDGTNFSVTELDVADFHNKDVQQAVEIAITFCDLNEIAKQRFSNYVRHEELTVKSRAVYNEQTKSAVVKQYGSRLAMRAFADFFSAASSATPVADLQGMYAALRQDKSDLPAVKTKNGMIEALREYEAARPHECELIDSEDEFYGFKGASRLSEFVQWVYIPAVKDAHKENADTKNTALGKLLGRAVRSVVNFNDEIKEIRENASRQYAEFIDSKQCALDGISESLSARLSELAHPDARVRLKWSEDTTKSISLSEPTLKLLAGDADFEGDIGRFGHGMQRSYLLALLQETGSLTDERQPSLIIGCEEPELYQHPIQARHLAEVFCELASDGAQVIVTTHSPYFISGRTIENVRLVVPASTRIDQITSVNTKQLFDEISRHSKKAVTPQKAFEAKLHHVLQPHISELCFAKHVVLVEGSEDYAYLMSWMVLTKRMKDFRRKGTQIITCNGKSSIHVPLLICRALEIPSFVMFDADGNLPEEKRSRSVKDNDTLISILGIESCPTFPVKTVHGADHTIWHDCIGDSLKTEVGDINWQNAFDRARQSLGSPSGDLKKNSMLIGSHLAIMHQQGIVIEQLESICNRILEN